MVNKNYLTTVVAQLMKALPSGSTVLKADIEKHLHNNLQAVLSKLNLVTREEFDVQAAVLQRTRQKLEAMEARVAQLVAAKQNRDK